VSVLRRHRLVLQQKMCQKSYILAYAHVTWPMTRTASGSLLPSALFRSGFESAKYLLSRALHVCICLFICQNFLCRRRIHICVCKKVSSRRGSQNHTHALTRNTNTTTEMQFEGVLLALNIVLGTKYCQLATI